MTEETTVRGVLEVDADGTWFYLHVPSAVREAWSARAHRGAIRVTATVGSTTWDGSLLPWADGSAQLTVNARVRRRESLTAGDEVTAVLRLRD